LRAAAMPAIWTSRISTVRPERRCCARSLFFTLAIPLDTNMVSALMHREPDPVIVGWLDGLPADW
jgi:hypothetical protein